MPMLTEPHGYWSVCFTNAASATFTGNAVDIQWRLLLISFWSVNVAETGRLAARLREHKHNLKEGLLENPN
jgi:hypothetical protein